MLVVSIVFIVASLAYIIRASFHNERVDRAARRSVIGIAGFMTGEATDFGGAETKIKTFPSTRQRQVFTSSST